MIAVAAAALASLGCSADDAPRMQARTADNAPSAAPTATAAVRIVAPNPPAISAPIPDGPRVATACAAPSTTSSDAIDARESGDLATCRFARTGAESSAKHCGKGDVRTGVTLARLDEAVLAFDDKTLSHLDGVARRGRALGRNARAFGLAGDSITEGAFFFDAFGAKSLFSYALSPEVEEALRTRVDGDAAKTIVDHYRGVRVEGSFGFWHDSFRAVRAAKIGARSTWAIPDDRPSPIVMMVEAISPATAVVMFGTNDSAYRIEEPEAMARGFEQRLGRIVDLLEARGVIPILSTIPRHMATPGRDPCKANAMSNWRLIVQSNALNAAIAKFACERALPLIDYRHALDALVNHGVGWDGVHPTAFEDGAGKLTSDGLECGYNVRNYVTLRMLKQVKEAVLDRLEGADAGVE